jgi:hypothetical protein
MDRRDFLAASASTLALAGGVSLPSFDPVSNDTELPPPPFVPGAPREVAVYTTADGTDHRLTPTGTVAFEPMGQPLESQVCVFVDPLGVAIAAGPYVIIDIFERRA